VLARSLLQVIRRIIKEIVNYTNRSLIFVCFTIIISIIEKRFDRRVIRKIFGPKRDEITGEWRRLHEEELHDL